MTTTAMCAAPAPSEGLVRALERGGLTVTGTADTASALLGLARTHRPDVVVMDAGLLRDGMAAAVELRRTQPETAVLVLSRRGETAFAAGLLEAGAEGLGYLLKDTISDPGSLVDAVRRVAAGGSVLDPAVVPGMAEADRREGPVGSLTSREREVLAMMAEGRSNPGIAAGLYLSLPAVERHITSIFAKLGLRAGRAHHRRVLAVLAYLRS
ncbi:LuxR C-terminal-related transcriptional regulator [Actinoplanes sp. CA-054009]